MYCPEKPRSALHLEEIKIKLKIKTSATSACADFASYVMIDKRRCSFVLDNFTHFL